MIIKQFRYASDNLAYMVYHRGEALAIDPGAADEMLAFAERQGLRIVGVTNTHDHADHTQGNAALLSRSGAPLIDHRNFSHGGSIALGDAAVTVYRTPGHMDDCVVFDCKTALITGDTLFNGTVGTCFSGDMAAFLDSILFLMGYPPSTLIYAGHDYVNESMAFARTIDRDNPEIDAYLSRHGSDPVVSTLAEELAANPFLRFDDPSMIEIMKRRGLPVGTRFERWCSLMELY
ncbi:hydroxyacylglutathione hydrolase [Desulfatiferula olefinivorans]